MDNISSEMMKDERWAAVGLAMAFTLAAALRIGCFPFTMESGDAPGRIALAVRWLHEPVLMTSKDCFAYAPLSILLNALALSIWDAPYTSPRLLTLIFGLATIFPLYGLAKILFGWRAALFAALFFAFYTLHVKFSTTAYAEVPGSFIFLSSLFFLFRFRRDGRLLDLIVSALLFTVGSLIRYEQWLFLPLLILFTVRPVKGKIGLSWNSLMPALLYGLIGAALPLAWMIHNYVELGDPLWNWRLTWAEHMEVAAEQATHRGALFARLYPLLFMPGVLVLSLTPVIAVLTVAGLVKNPNRKLTLMYCTLFLPYLVYYAQTVMGQMMAQARYYLMLGLLLLPYAGAQMDAWTSGLTPAAILRRTVGVLLTAAAAFGAYTWVAFHPAVPFHQKIWSVAPVSPFLPEEKAVYDLIMARIRPNDQIVQNGNTRYTHIITFHISPRIYENWWGRPVIEELKTPQERIRFLESSAPGFAVFEPKYVNLPKLLGVPENRLRDFSNIIIECIYSSPKYIVYQLIPKPTTSKLPKQ